MIMHAHCLVAETRVCRRDAIGRPHAQVDVYSFGVVLWELVTKEQAMRGQLRDVLVPSECPQVLHPHALAKGPGSACLITVFLQHTVVAGRADMCDDSRRRDFRVAVWLPGPVHNAGKT